MPSNTTQTSQEYHNTLYTPSSNIQEPLLQQQDSSLPQAAPKDFTQMLGFEKLLSIVGVHIEKTTIIGKAECCGPPARIDAAAHSYKISDLRAFGAEEKGQSGPPILQGKEIVEDSSNIWCVPGHRAFDIEVNNGSDKDATQSNFHFLKLERKFKCSFLCVARPEMIVSLVEEGKNEKLGRIVNPIQCCVDFRMNIYDASDIIRYVIKADCCDWGVSHPGGCGVRETIMTVYDPFGNVESKLRIFDGCNFSMAFPKNSNKSERALLLAAIMMIGKTFFELAGPLTICCAICEGLN